MFFFFFKMFLNEFFDILEMINQLDFTPPTEPNKNKKKSKGMGI